MSLVEQELLTLTNHLGSLPFCFVCNSVFVLLTFSTHMSSCFTVYYELHIQTMFDSFLFVNVICIYLRSLVHWCPKWFPYQKMLVLFDSHMTGVTSRAEMPSHSGTSEFTSVLAVVPIGPCSVCTSSIYGFKLSLWYL